MNDWSAMTIALKRVRDDQDGAGAETSKRHADVSSLLLRQFAIHPMLHGDAAEIPLRLLMDTMHRTAVHDPAASIFVRMYTRVAGLHMYQVPASTAIDTLRFGDVVRIDILGVRADRKTQTDDVLHLTYDFSYLRAFPALEVFYVLNCNACLGSHLAESAPHLKSLYINSCDIFFVAPDFDVANESGIISLVNLVDRSSGRAP